MEYTRKDIIEIYNELSNKAVNATNKKILTIVRRHSKRWVKQINNRDYPRDMRKLVVDLHKKLYKLAMKIKEKLKD